jgi:hypothetical protein
MHNAMGTASAASKCGARTMLLMFDMDGTLTSPRALINDHMKKWLNDKVCMLTAFCIYLCLA